MNPAESWHARGRLLTGAAQRRYRRLILPMVRSMVQDAGGKWTRAVADAARAKIESTLNEPSVSAVIAYHALDYARLWGGGSKDHRFAYLVRCVTGSIGRLLPDSVITSTVAHLATMGDRDDALSPAIAEHLRDRIRRAGGEDECGEAEGVG